MAGAQGMSTEAKGALHRLLHDIATDFFTQDPNESKERFVPKCLEHVKELTTMVDRHYTDVQLESVLQHECQLSKEFPNTRSSNFHTHEACMEFATKLSDARMKELETGETGQYNEHAATGAVAVKTEKVESTPEKTASPKPEKP